MPSIDYAHRLARTRDRLQESTTISPANQRHLEQYLATLADEGATPATQHQNVSHLLRIATQLADRDFHTLDHSDVETVIEWIEQKDVSPATARQYLEIFQRFCRWLFNTPDDTDPDIIEWIEIPNHRQAPEPEKPLLRPAEIHAMAGATANTRDAAFVEMLWETGARIGEFLDLKRRDLTPREDTIYVDLGTNQSQRQLPLLQSGDSVAEWLDAHPGDSPHDPLWSSLSTVDEVSYHYYHKMLSRFATKAIGQDQSNDHSSVEAERLNHVTPNHVRHSRAIDLGVVFSRDQLRTWFGWTMDSNQPDQVLNKVDSILEEPVSKSPDADIVEVYRRKVTGPECSECERLLGGAPQPCRFCWSLKSGATGGFTTPDAFDEHYASPSQRPELLEAVKECLKTLEAQGDLDIGLLDEPGG